MRLDVHPLRKLRILAVVCILLPAAPLVSGQGQSASPRPGEGGDHDPALRDYYSANGLLNRGMNDLAAAEYRKFLAEHAQHEKAPVARYGLGVSLFRQQKYEETIAELAPLQKAKGFAYGAEVGVLLGQSYLALKQPGPAADAFESVVTRYGPHELADDAAAGCAEALYLAGKFDESVARAGVLTSRWPDSPLRERTEFFWGLALMGAGQPAAAADRFAEFLKRYPGGALSPRATLLLAQCCHTAGDLERAEGHYRRAVETAQGESEAEALYGLAIVLQQRGNAKEAGRLLDRLLKDHADHPLASSAQLQRGRVWFDQGGYDEALEAFKAIRKDDEALRDDAAYWMAKCRLRAGDFDDAAKRLRTAIEKHPDSELLAEMMYDRAVALVRGDKPDPAVEALSEFRARFTDHALAADALHLLALTEHQRRQFDRSLEHCRTFVAQYGGHPLAPAVSFLAAENQFLAGSLEAAATAYQKFLADHGSDEQASRARFRLGTVLHQLGRLDEAQAALAELGDGLPDDFRAGLLTLGDIHFQRGEWKAAEERLAAYLSTGAPGSLSRDVPAADDALVKLGLARQRQGSFAAAIDAFDLLVKHFDRSPHRLQAVFERGQCLAALNRQDEAVAAFEKVLAEGRDSRFAPHALNHLAAIDLERRRFDEAARRFAQVERSADDQSVKAEALFQQGQAATAGGDFKTAEKAFRQYLDHHAGGPRAGQACAQLGIALARQDQADRALEVFDRFSRQFGQNAPPELTAAVLYEKAWCLRSLGRTDDAAKTYHAMLEGRPEAASNPHALVELAEIESAAGRYPAAIALLERLREMAKHDDKSVSADVRAAGLYRLGLCSFEAGEHEKAAALLGEFVEAFPESKLTASASYFCGESLYKLGRYESASTHFTRIAEGFADDPACGPSLLRLGECLAALQRWPRSERVLADYLERFRGSEHGFQAQFGVGWARENQGRFDEAVAAYREVIDHHQGPTAARAQFQIGECLFAQKKYEDAVRELLKVDILYAYPEWSAAALYEAGRCFEKLNQPGKAREQFAAVAEKYKESQWAELASKRLAAVPSDALPGR